MKGKNLIVYEPVVRPLITPQHYVCLPERISTWLSS